MKKEIQEQIGKELSKLRIDHNYDIETLSDKSHISKDTLYKYEKGLGNNLDTLAKILEAYDINFSIFFEKVYDNMQ